MFPPIHSRVSGRQKDELVTGPISGDRDDLASQVMARPLRLALDLVVLAAKPVEALHTECEVFGMDNDTRPRIVGRVGCQTMLERRRCTAVNLLQKALVIGR